jgi:hypothetical protein
MTLPNPFDRTRDRQEADHPQKDLARRTFELETESLDLDWPLCLAVLGASVERDARARRQRARLRID